MNSMLKWLPRGVGMRMLGVAGAVGLASGAGAPGNRAYDICMECCHNGVMVRPAGENVVVCPPFIVEKEHIDRIENMGGARYLKRNVMRPLDRS